MDKEILVAVLKIVAALITFIAATIGLFPKVYKWYKNKRATKKINEVVPDKNNFISKRSDDGVFVGRDDEISDLIKLIQDFNLIVVKGNPGIGKTTLVRNLLLNESIKNQFKNNLLFVELSEQFTPDGVCNKILEKFGKSVREGDLSPSLQVFQELKQYSDYLIVFDNCEQIPDDVFSVTIRYWAENFQNSKNFSFVVTSRKDHGSGRKLNLEALQLPRKISDTKSETTRAIIQKIKIHKPEFKLADGELEKLYNVAIKTGGVPWLIQMVAGKINYMSINDIEVSVRDIKPGDREKFFNKSYNEISENAQYVFDQLAIFEDGFTYYAYKSVVKMLPSSEENHQEVLENLIRYSFVNFNSDIGRYTMLVHVKEIGELILEKWDKVDLLELARRSSGFYYDFVVAKSSLLSNFDTNLINKALDEMSAEKENVFRSQIWLNELKSYEKLTDLSILFDEVLYSRGPATLRIDKLRYAYDNVNEEKIDLIVQLSIALSKANWSSGRWIKAEGFAKKAESIGVPNTIMHAKALQQLGRILKDRGFLVESKRLLSEAKTIYDSKNVKDVIDIDNLNAELGNTYDQLGLFEKCIEVIGTTTGLSKSVSLANKYNRISLANWHHGRVDDAIKNIDVAISICIDINHKARAAAYTTNKALIQIDKEDFDPARITFQKNFEDHKESGHKQWLAVNHGGLGRLYLRRNNKKFNDIDSAEIELLKALRLSEDVGYSENMAWHLGDLGRMYFLKKNYKKAIDCTQKAIKLQRQMGAINSLRHFSNHITVLRSVDRISGPLDDLLDIRKLDSLFNSMSIYLSRIKGVIDKPQSYLQDDIAFLKSFLRKTNDLDLYNLASTLDLKIPEVAYELLNESRNNEAVGAFEYHNDKLFKWKYFKIEFAEYTTINLFTYGILRNQKIRKQLGVDDNAEDVYGHGIIRKLNHLAEPGDYLGYGEGYPNGFLAYNIEYTGDINDTEKGVLLPLSMGSINTLGKDLKGFALRPITIKRQDNTVDVAFTYTSTNRVYNSRVVTTEDGPINQKYITDCNS